MLGNLISEIEKTKTACTEIKKIPDIILNDNIKAELESYLLTKYEVVSILAQTSYVKTSEGLFSIFSNQYFFLAKLCKDFALILNNYFRFLDENIRPNKTYVKTINDLQEKIQAHDGSFTITPRFVYDYLKNGISNYDSLISNMSEDEKKSMLVFLSTQIDLFKDGDKKENFKKFKSSDSFRSSTDLYISIILKILPVENVSSNMLGTLIYHLSKNEELYAKLCENVEVVDFSDTKTIFVNDEEKSYTCEELSEILKNDYNNAEEGGKVSAIHLLGIRYGGIIKENDYSISKIISDAGLSSTYTTELTKGVNLYYKILSGKYKLRFEPEPNEKEDDEKKIPVITEMERKAFLSTELIKRNDYHKRFIPSLISKQFVILTGNSGTGKTRIATELATYLGKIDSDNQKTIYGKENIVNKLIVPVGADWTDNTKILGFYNPLEKEYQSTPILDFILLARKNPNIPFFLILDEMNLSYVERYFSDFLSAMESGEPIPLYKKSVEDNSAIPENVVLPDNLFVTGTVNIDETTYMFSSKVLDRANVIEFIPEPKDILNNFAEESSKDEILPKDDGSAEGFLDLSRAVRKTKKISNEAAITKNMMEGIIAILSNSDFEFAFRTSKEIRLYINAAEQLAKNASKTLEEKDYINLIDEQLVQKILPKIHGNRNQIGLLLKNLYDFCNSKTVKISDAETGTEKEIPGYALELSRKKIARMQRKLETSQFASFI
ncbi:MAG: hypothetical protein J5710_09820 [Treponema sp.]|nr:hypothetical protein [Treponema sp.]